MKKILFILISGIIIFALSIFLGIQAIKFIYLKDPIGISLDPTLLSLRAGAWEFTLFVGLLIWLGIIYMILTSGSHSKKKKSKDDLESFSKLSSLREAKKGTTRLSYDSEKLLEHSAMDVVDQWLDPSKRLINSFLTLLRVDDVKKLNTIKTWNIEDKKVHKRGGLPIYTPLIFKHHSYVDSGDTHTKILGMTGSGKSFSLILQLIENLRMTGESMLINDMKGELYDYTAASLVRDGYNVIKLNFIDPKNSDGWNPLTSIWKTYQEAYDRYEKELKDWELKKAGLSGGRLAEHLLSKPRLNVSEANEQLLSLASTLCYDENTKDPFWKEKAADLISGCASFLMEEGNEALINFKSVKLLGQLGFETISKELRQKLGINVTSYLSYYIKNFRKPDDFSSMQLRDTLDGAADTTKGILSTFNQKLRILTANEDIMKMTSQTTFNLEDAGKKKTAIFLIVHDEKKIYHPLVTLFTKQLYEALIKVTRETKHTGAGEFLPIPFNFIIDEFGNCPPFQDIDSILTAGRSRGIRFYLAVQNDQQISDKYGEKMAATIQSQCTNTVFLMSNDQKTLKNFSDMCGSHQVWVPSQKRYETRPVISTDRLQHLNIGEVVIHRQRRNPFITRMLAYNKCVYYKGKRDSEQTFPKFKEVAYYNIIDMLIQRLKEKGDLEESYGTTV